MDPPNATIPLLDTRRNFELQDNLWSRLMKKEKHLLQPYPIATTHFVVAYSWIVTGFSFFKAYYQPCSVGFSGGCHHMRLTTWPRSSCAHFHRWRDSSNSICCVQRHRGYEVAINPNHRNSIRSRQGIVCCEKKCMGASALMHWETSTCLYTWVAVLSEPRSRCWHIAIFIATLLAWANIDIGPQYC